MSLQKVSDAMNIWAKDVLVVYLAVNLMAVQITTVKNWRVSRADIQNILSRGAEGILEARRGAIIIVLKMVKINVKIVYSSKGCIFGGSSPFSPYSPSIFEKK